MSARDDYPKAAGFAAMQGPSISRWREVADALDEIDRLRAVIAGLPECPTCGGKGVVVTPDSIGKAFFAVLDEGHGAGVPHLACPDCSDGRVSLGWLTAVFAAVWDDTRGLGGWDLDRGWNTAIEDLRAVRP